MLKNQSDRSESMKYLSVLLISIIMAACNPQKIQEKPSPGILKRFASMDSAFQTGDTVAYLKNRKFIESEIQQSKDPKYQLYLETFDAQNILSAGYLDSAAKAFESIGSRAASVKVFYSQFVANNMLGNIAFLKEDDLKAVEYWEKGLKIAGQHKFINQIPDLYSNMGSSYMRLGYFNSSSFHLLRAQELMDSLGIDNENYWINHINIAIAFLELNRYDKAFELLSQTQKSFSSQIAYLYHLNMASYYSAIKDHEKFLSYLDSADIYLASNKEYFLTNLEFKISKLIEIHDIDRLMVSINEFINYRDEKPVTLRCYFNRAYKLVYGKFFDSEDQIMLLEKSIGKEDYVTMEIYTALMADFYQLTGNKMKEADYLRKNKDFSDKLVKQKLNHQLEDNYWSLKNEQIISENRLLAMENQAQSVRHNTERIIYISVIIAVLSSLSALILVLKNIRKSKNLKEVELQLTESNLAYARARSDELNRNIELQKKQLNEVHKLIKKTTVFKNQLEYFFTKIKSVELPEELDKITRSTDLDFRVFYSIYQQHIDKYLIDNTLKMTRASMESDYPDLTSRELDVIEYVLNDYSTPDIAALLGKSIKSIELIRSVIRKKLNIQKDIDLRNFLRDKYPIRPKNPADI